MKIKRQIPEKFLWEYDVDTFNYDKSYKIVIEKSEFMKLLILQIKSINLLFCSTSLSFYSSCLHA